jgi:hypothetical protein
MISFTKAKELKLKPERVRALITEIEQQGITKEIRRMQHEHGIKNKSR